MKSLLVCSVLVAATSAQYLGYPYAVGAPLTYAVKETGCVNSFGAAVPCAQEGEARRKRAADDEEAAAPVPVLAYAGLPYAGLCYAGLGYPYTYGLPYAAAPVKAAEPVVTEVEVPQIVYKPVEQKIELAPACHNAFGWPVPCA